MGSKKPVCVGTGLVTLDIVINRNPELPPRLWAGGSCGNVLTILSYLGWRAYLIARLGDDEAAAELLKDMESWKVKTTLVSRDSSQHTPVVVEKLGLTKNGIPWHRFEWTCPVCGSWLPKHKSVAAKAVEQISGRVPRAKVFYFDRVARSSVELAKVSKSHGAAVVFEPSGIKNQKLFLECLEISDLVKYSHERLGHVRELTQNRKVPLEIETLGAEGLRYRLRTDGRQSGKWKRMQAHTVKNLKDAAGAGDWCSAGIIHWLCSAGSKTIGDATTQDIETALDFGQILAAVNCYFEGARGIMYSVSKRKFNALVHDMWNGTGSPQSLEEKEGGPTRQVFGRMCPGCAKKDAGK